MFEHTELFVGVGRPLTCPRAIQDKGVGSDPRPGHRLCQGVLNVLLEAL